MTTPALEFALAKPPGGLLNNDLLGLVELLLADEVFASGKLSVLRDKVPLSPEEPAVDLADRLSSSLLAGGWQGGGLTVLGDRSAELTVSPSTASDLNGTIRGFVPSVEHDLLLERVLDVAEYVDALHASIFVDGSFSGRDYNYFIPVKEVVEKVPQGRLQIGASGLAGVGYRSIVGKPFTDLYKPEDLKALESEGLAWQQGSFWVLAGSETIEEWDKTQWCEQERHIIETLGTEYFFDPETSALPSVWPELPEGPSRTVVLCDPKTKQRYLRDPDGTQRLLNIDAEETDEAVRQFGARAASVTSEMTELVPEFKTDDQLYWVEEQIADRPKAEHPALITLYGAWLGEYLRVQIDGSWVRETDSESWVVQSPNGDKWNVHGRVAKFLTDRNDDLKSFVAAATTTDQ